MQYFLRQLQQQILTANLQMNLSVEPDASTPAMPAYILQEKMMATGIVGCLT